jgi:hypothetical protein
LANYALAALGAPLGAGSLDWSRAAALAVVALLLTIVLSWRRSGREELAREAPLGALVLFGLLSCAMIAYGRAASAISPLESRYIAYSTVAVVGVWLLVVVQGRQPAAAAALALLLPGLLAANLWGLREAKVWRLQRLQDAFLMETAESQPPEALEGRYGRAELLRVVPFLRARRLGPFAGPPDVLLLVRWREGSVAGEVLPGRPLEERFVCPVGRLWEAGVAVSTLGRVNTSTLSISLWEGERLLARRTLPGSSLAEARWESISLAEPLPHCQGRVLTLRLESPDAAPGNAASAWTYPRYYEGELRQAGLEGAAPLAADRSLGLELNAFHAGLLP